MGKMKWVVGLKAVPLFIALTACTGDKRPEPVTLQPAVSGANRDAGMFKQAPAPWREYLLKAHAAEAIADPLQRCLSFPDLPGVHWPKGAAESLCRLNFPQQVLTPAQIGEMVDNGRLAQLEQALDADLEHHFGDEHSEAIHRDLAFELDAGGKNQAIVEKWLKAAPNSAYANAAYGRLLFNQARNVRGAKLAKDTPEKDLKRMSALMNQAVPYLGKAIQAKPKLMPAYLDLMQIGNYLGEDSFGEDMFKQAQGIDPTCFWLVKLRLMALEPRWGGSHAAMQAYQRSLQPYLRQRPVLSAFLSSADYDALNWNADQRDSENWKDGYMSDDTLRKLVSMAAAGPNIDVLEQVANVAVNTHAHGRDAGYYQGFAYLWQESRFVDPLAVWASVEMGNLLQTEDPELALKYAQRALESEPENAWAYRVAGLADKSMKRLEDADKYFNLALQYETDPAQKEKTLQYAATMWLYKAGLADATRADRSRPYVDELLREFPNDGANWIMRMDESLLDNPTMDADTLRTQIGQTLVKVDFGQPWQAEQARRFEKMQETGVAQPLR